MMNGLRSPLKSWHRRLEMFDKISDLGIKQRKVSKLGIRGRIYGLICVQKGEKVMPGYQRRTSSFHEKQTVSPLY